MESFEASAPLLPDRAQSESRSNLVNAVRSSGDSLDTSLRFEQRRARKLLKMNRIYLLLGLLVAANGAAPADSKHDLKGRGECKLCHERPTDFFGEDAIARKFNQQVTFDEFLQYAMRSLKLIAGFDNDLHRYDRKADLVNSFERNLTYNDDSTLKLKAHIDPSERRLLDDQSELLVIENERNQKSCGEQLTLLIGETQKLFSSEESYSQSRQLSLIDFLSSFGSIPVARLTMGNTISIGSPDQCTRSRLALDSASEDLGARYCLANYRSKRWPVELGDSPERLGGESFKLGVCLPRSCNSVSILRHSAKIDALVKLTRMNQVPYSSYRLTHLFCLPDEASPLRQFSWSARMFLATLSCWLALVAFYSVKYEYLLMRHQHQPDASLESAMSTKPMRIFAFRLSWERLFDQPSDRLYCGAASPNAERRIEFTLADSRSTESESGIDTSDSESIDSQPTATRAIKGTIKPTPEERLALNSQLYNYVVASAPQPKQNPNNLHRSASQIVLSHNERLDKWQIDASQPAEISRNSSKDTPIAASRTSSAPAVNLAAIDGIKVLSMIWLISAHTLLFFIRSISNGRDFWSILRDARFMTIMAGIFPVDSFFTITGILTAYLRFNKNDGDAMMRIKYWIEAFVHRYLRFMPMYLLVFWYTRDVSEYIGSGPLWDYATTDTSLRSVCKRESVTVPLLFQANFKSLEQHCVKPAWYLANDYQCLLVTPIFVALILKSKILGYSAICLSVALSLVAQFLTVFLSSEFTDHKGLVNFEPMFATYVLKDLWQLYVLPWNRMAPFLIGLLTGHLMHSLNRVRKLTHSLGAGLSESQSTDSIASFTTSSSARGVSGNLSANRAAGEPSPQKPSPRQPRRASVPFVTVVMRHVCSDVWMPLLVLISIIYLPLTTKISTLNDDTQAKIGASSIIALMRFAWSAAIARLIYVCATRVNHLNESFVVRLMSSPKWRPWSKIGLSALLIQWEIISYFAQTQTDLPVLTISYLMAFILICIVSTYCLALLLYLTIEYPLSQVESLYISPLLF